MCPRMHHWPTWPCSFLHINTLEDSDNCNHSNHFNHGNSNYGNSCHNGNCNQARAKPNWGSGRTVIVYVSRACTKENLERIPLLSSFWNTFSYFFGHFEHLQAFLVPWPRPGLCYIWARVILSLQPYSPYSLYCEKSWKDSTNNSSFGPSGVFRLSRRPLGPL